MNCIICDDKRPLVGQAISGRLILLTPCVQVWCCDTCIDAILLNACRNAFHEGFMEVNS